MADYAVVKKLKGYKSQIATDDPWVQRVATAAMEDTYYITMIHHIEIGTEPKDIPKDCELVDMSGCWRNLSVTTIKGGKIKY